MRFHRIDDLAGFPRYRVTAAGTDLGTVFRRRGGWWSGNRVDGGFVSSWCSTRAEAADYLA